VFLATTALIEFWDREDEIVFLGPWCRRYDRRADWESLRYTTMPSPWDDRKRYYDAASYLDACGERMLVRLADYLNAAHDVSYTTRYWRIVIGQWLMVFLCSVYDRHALLMEAFERYGDSATRALDPSSFRIPSSGDAATWWLGADAYNLQIFSQLFTALGRSFPSRPCSPALFPLSPDQRGPARSRSRRFIANAAGLLARVVESAIARPDRVALYHTSIPSSTAWSLSLRSGFRVIPLSTVGDEVSDDIPPVFDRRRNGLATFESTDAFERIFVALLPQAFPTLYLEGYERLRDTTHRRHRSRAATIVTETGWYGSETFKHFAAAAAEKHVRLVASQHGLAYGIYRFMPYYLHETRFSDAFLSWGWAETHDFGHRNWPHPRLSQIGRVRRRQPTGVVMVATAAPRYLHMFHSSPVGGQWEDYLDWERRYLSSLSSQQRSALRFRPAPGEDVGLAPWSRIADRFPEIQLSDRQHFADELARASLMVVDHPGTAFAEALQADVPTIAFWDPDRWEMRERAAADFASLRRLGIVCDSPERAAEQTMAVYDDPTRWWQQRDVRAARDHFVGRYAAGSVKWHGFWGARLKDACAPRTG
jgi:putative transferase (TIGR04331 family)